MSATCCGVASFSRGLVGYATTIAVRHPVAASGGDAGACPRPRRLRRATDPCRHRGRQSRAALDDCRGPKRWQVDVGFHASELHAPRDAVSRLQPGTSDVLSGFGDRPYLMTRDQSSCSGLLALWPGPGRILVSGLAAPPESAFRQDRTTRIKLANAQARAAETFIWASMSQGEKAVEPVATRPHDGSVYYAANPVYLGMHTCNTWAAEVLEAAGLPIRSRRVFLAGQIWRKAKPCAEGKVADARGSSLPCTAVRQ